MGLQSSTPLFPFFFSISSSSESTVSVLRRDDVRPSLSVSAEYMSSPLWVFSHLTEEALMIPVFKIVCIMFCGFVLGLALSDPTPGAEGKMNIDQYGQ